MRVGMRVLLLVRARAGGGIGGVVDVVVGGVVGGGGGVGVVGRVGGDAADAADDAADDGGHAATDAGARTTGMERWPYAAFGPLGYYDDHGDDDYDDYCYCLFFRKQLRHPPRCQHRRES
jgi:hypothetical protein